MSKWYVDPREYADTLHEDLKLRKALLAAPEVSGAEISEVEIIRKPQRITLVVGTARPGCRRGMSIPGSMQTPFMRISSSERLFVQLLR